MAKSGKYYVVWEGIEPGIYDNWEDAQEQVTTYPGARFKSFKSYDEAVRAFRGDDAEECKVLLEYARQPAKTTNYASLTEIAPDAIAVDGACSGNPGPMEYRGVMIHTGEELFHVGPLQGGTNNIGEYLALIHAIAYCAQRGEPHRQIYSDSRTGLSWLSKRRSNTHIIPTPANAKVRELLARADRWISTHSYSNPIRKWDTENWGEIPADFNRK